MTETDRQPRTDRGRRTRDGLVSAARLVFEEQGFAATRMSDLAAAARVSHGTVYTYFDTKEDVLAAVVEQMVDELRDSIRSANLSDPVERIANANARYLASFGSNARLLRVIEEVSVVDQRFAEILDGLRRTHVGRVAAQIERLQASGVVDRTLPPPVAAAALCAMVEGFSRHWNNLGPPEDPRGLTTLTTLWQRGLGLPDAVDRDNNGGHPTTDRPDHPAPPVGVRQRPDSTRTAHHPKPDKLEEPDGIHS